MSLVPLSTDVSPIKKRRMEISTRLVIPLGFEPKTHSLEGCCSIQLSYGTYTFLRFAAAKLQKYFQSATDYS